MKGHQSAEPRISSHYRHFLPLSKEAAPWKLRPKLQLVSRCDFREDVAVLTSCAHISAIKALERPNCCLPCIPPFHPSSLHPSIPPIFPASLHSTHLPCIPAFHLRSWRLLVADLRPVQFILRQLKEVEPD